MHIMLSRLVIEFREIFDTFVCVRLHPHDIVALGAVCRDMRTLCTHSVHVHVCTFVPVLRDLRAQRYVVMGPSYGYSRARDDAHYFIYRDDSALLSVRICRGRNIFYGCWRGRKTWKSQSRSVRVDAFGAVLDGSPGNYTSIDSHIDGERVFGILRTPDYEYMWMSHHVGLEHLFECRCGRIIARYLDGVQLVAFTCGRIYDAICAW